MTRCVIASLPEVQLPGNWQTFVQIAMQTPGGVIRIWSSSDGNQPVLAFAAPKIDGIHMYTWVDAQQMWCSKADGHFLKEILARELVYWCKGFPTF